MMRFKPTAIVFGGYTPDTAVILRDVHRAGYEGVKLAFGYSVNQKLVEELPAEVVDGTYVVTPSSADKSTAYAHAAKLAGVKSPDPYTAQMYDQINLVILALGHGGGEMNGTTIRNNIRSISQGAGRIKVDNAVEGLRLVAAKKAIDYEGASGPCDFTEIGDITDSRFRYEQVRAGKFVRTVKMD